MKVLYDMTGSPQTEQESQTDQYGELLQATEEGLILTINNSTAQPAGTGELTVQYSHPDKTKVGLTGSDGTDFEIYREQGKLVYGEITDGGVSYEGDVITLEIIGVTSSPP